MPSLLPAVSSQDLVVPSDVGRDSLQLQFESCTKCWQFGCRWNDGWGADNPTIIGCKGLPSSLMWEYCMPMSQQVHGLYTVHVFWMSWCLQHSLTMCAVRRGMNYGLEAQHQGYRVLTHGCDSKYQILFYTLAHHVWVDFDATCDPYFYSTTVAAY